MVTAQQRKKMGQETHVLDPFRVMANKGVNMQTSTMDIFAQLDPTSDHFTESVKGIADALVIRSASESQPFFNNAATQLIIGAIAHMITSDNYPNPQITDLPSFWGYGEEKRMKLAEEMLANKKSRGLTQGVARVFAEASNQYASSGGITAVMTSYYEHVNWLEHDPFPEFLNATPDKPNFNFQSLKDKPSSVYFTLSEVKEHARLVRLFLNYATTVLIQGQKTNQPILMIIDEFLSLGRMERIKRAFTEFAGHGLVCWPLIQNLGGLYGIYGEYDSGDFLGNSRAVQVFAANDRYTQEWLVGNFDRRSLDLISDLNQSNKLEGLRSPAEARMETRRETKKQYVIGSKWPLLLKRREYYKDEFFAGKYAPHPDYR